MLVVVMVIVVVVIIVIIVIIVVAVVAIAVAVAGRLETGADAATGAHAHRALERPGHVPWPRALAATAALGVIAIGQAHRARGAGGVAARIGGAEVDAVGAADA